jgi:hypothetical protein
MTIYLAYRVGQNRVYIPVLLLRIMENLDFMSLPNLEFEELFSHIYILLLPHPAGRPAASRCLVLCKSTVYCEEAFAITKESLSVIASWPNCTFLLSCSSSI